MWSFIITTYLLIGVVVVFIQYNYITKIAIEVLNENSYLIRHWSQQTRTNYVNYVMPCLFIFVWLPLLLPGED